MGRIVIVAAVVTILGGCMSSQEKLDKAVSKLRVGMTMEEVRAALGSPDRVDYEGDVTAWKYAYGDDGARWAGALHGASSVTATAGGDPYGSQQQSYRQEDAMNRGWRALGIRFDDCDRVIWWLSR